MSTYTIKTYAVVPGSPLAPYEAEGEVTYHTSETEAASFLDWWIGDQGRKDSFIYERWFECAVVDGSVIVPDCIETPYN